MKRRLVKWLTKCVGMSLAMVITLAAKGQVVYAATTYNDTESNNTHNEAQIIVTNAQTPTQAVSGLTSVYRSVKGTLTGGDEDWYKVSLDSNDEIYLDMNVGTGTIFVDIYNSSNFDVPMDTFEYQRNGDTNVYEVNIAEDGVYYLRLYHTTSVSSTYNFTIGNPQYTLGSYTHNFGSITLASKATWEDTVNLTNVSDIPDRAIGYEISIGGCNTSVSSKRYFFNEFYDQWVATKTTYSYSLPVTDNSLLDQEWGARIISSSSSASTFSPTMTIRYVAPDLP